MNRYYYISDSLDSLEHLQDDLVTKGVDYERIHVLTEQDVEVSTHHVNQMESLAKKDVVRSGLRGAMVGLVLALAIIVIALFVGLMSTVWAIPILFLAAVIFGFCTWEGGLIGVHRPHPEVQRFEKQLKQGQHVLFVDAEDDEKQTVAQSAAAQDNIKPAGTGKPESEKVAHVRQSLRNFIRSLP
jgi:hypothetical protein